MISRSGYPLYLQLKSLLMEKIDTGEWLPGTMIPTENDLTEEHGVSRTTVRQAIADLVSAGTLIRQQGRGTFVASAQSPHSTSVLYGLLEELELTERNVILSKGTLTTMPCQEEVAIALHVPLHTPVLCIERHMQEDGSTIYADECYIPASLIHPHGIEDQRLIRKIYQTFEAHGIVIASGDQSITAETASLHFAQVFACQEGEALLRIERITRDASGVPIEYSIARYLASSYSYEVRLRRSM